jgi:transposase
MSLPKLGVDISKNSFNVALICDPQTMRRKQHQFPNTTQGFQTLQTWLAKQGVSQVHAVMEATGTYCDSLAQFLHTSGHSVSIVNPAQIKAFGQSHLQRNKTDRADAVLIARFAWQHKPTIWTPPEPQQRDLQLLVRHLDDLIQQRTQVSNRLSEGRHNELVRESWLKLLKTINEQIDEVKRRINQHFDDHPKLKRQRELLDSIPGIGPETAARLLGEMPQLAEMNSARAAAAHAGLTPRCHQSGSSINAPTRLSKIGNRRVRYALYMPAMAALRSSREFKELAWRLTKRGKKKMQIIAAAMHKLVRIAHGVLKHQQAYEPNYATTA